MPMPSLIPTTYDSVTAFRDRIQPFLMRQEAANNLMLGLIHTLIVAPQHFDAAPYLATVDRDGEVAAACLRTPPHNLILSTTEYPEAIEPLATFLHDASVVLPGVTGPTALSTAFADHWQRLAGGRVERLRALRIFALHQVRPVPGVAGSLREATHHDRALLIAWVTAFSHEAVTATDPGRIAHAVDGRLESEDGGFWLWEVAGEPVSLVGAIGPTPTGIRIGPVYTPPEQRRHGYASAATAAVSQHLLDAGRAFCFLYADLANSTANRIYQVIGYESVCDAADFVFRQ
ncbi:MAG: GNAT family N-acetyltransferase [Chloroflexota bacterium]|nr:GNAT family N-acetyltransferase [Chloroflexota bacterium]